MKVEEIAIWEAFRGVAIHGGFSKASKKMKESVPQISKRVAKLEDSLGVRLFQRSTRVVSLTDEGRALLPKVSAILEDLASIETSFENTKDLSGTIRITAVPFLAHRLLIPVIAKFRKLHPLVEIDIEISEGMVNLADSNIDLAIRIYDEPEDSNLIYRKLMPNQLVLCASPRYLKNHPTPIRTPRDLKNHELLMLEVHGGCQFINQTQPLADFAPSQKIVCENGWLLTQMALEGFGVLVRSLWDVRQNLEKGELIQVLKNAPLEPFGHVYAVIPSRRLLAPRVRTFLDFVLAEAKEL